MSIIPSSVTGKTADNAPRKEQEDGSSTAEKPQGVSTRDESRGDHIRNIGASSKQGIRPGCANAVEAPLHSGNVDPADSLLEPAAPRLDAEEPPLNTVDANMVGPPLDTADANAVAPRLDAADSTVVEPPLDTADASAVAPPLDAANSTAVEPPRETAEGRPREAPSEPADLNPKESQHSTRPVEDIINDHHGHFRQENDVVLSSAKWVCPPETEIPTPAQPPSKRLRTLSPAEKLKMLALETTRRVHASAHGSPPFHSGPASIPAAHAPITRLLQLIRSLQLSREAEHRLVRLAVAHDERLLGLFYVYGDQIEEFRQFARLLLEKREEDS